MIFRLRRIVDYVLMFKEELVHDLLLYTISLPADIVTKSSFHTYKAGTYFLLTFWFSWKISISNPELAMEATNMVT